ncbi:E3 SUMO-protein ligase pli1 [Xanthoria parietina]
MAPHSAFETNTVEQKVKTLVNAHLKSILKKENLLVSGVKVAMQRRINAQLQLHADNQDLNRFNRLKGFIMNPESMNSPAAPYPLNQLPYSNFPQVAGRQPDLLPHMLPGSSTRPIFKDSPFYTILQHLTPVQECKVREATRDTIECKIILKPDVADKLVSEPDLRVMIFCASEPISHFSKVDVAFPHQVEIKVNLDEVKANLRGLKNRAGSTRPADITNLLRKRAYYENSMTLTYALTHKKFYFVVNLVRQHPVEELVAKLKSGKTISKDQVIREMISKAQDSDVQAIGSIISLKCPLSTLRIDVPCRSTVCTHNQCFDATSFLQLQEQAPTWTCPVCNKTVSFEALEIDLYVDDILKLTPKTIDQVTVEPDGKWSRISEHGARPKPGHDSSDDDEDLVEIKDPPRVTAVKNGMANGSISMRTPPTSSREQSATSSVPPPSIGTKRSVSAVIDLTSDDEEENPRHPKKSATPAYLTTPTYSSPGNGRAQPVANSLSSFGPYSGNPPAEPNYIQRGYPHR